MNFPMIFCTWREANDFGFHQAIMDDTAWMAFIIAIVIGALTSVLYYLIVGKSARLSNIWTWLIALLIGLCLNYFVTDQVIVGSPINKQNGVNANSICYEYSFFHSIDKHTTDLVKSKKYKNNPEAKEKINERKRNLSKSIEKGNDIVLTYEFSCLFWMLFFFVVTSYCVKNSTEQASGVPTYWPQKHND